MEGASEDVDVEECVPGIPNPGRDWRPRDSHILTHVDRWHQDCGVSPPISPKKELPGGGVIAMFSVGTECLLFLFGRWWGGRSRKRKNPAIRRHIAAIRSSTGVLSHPARRFCSCARPVVLPSLSGSGREATEGYPRAHISNSHSTHATRLWRGKISKLRSPGRTRANCLP